MQIVIDAQPGSKFFFRTMATAPIPDGHQNFILRAASSHADWLKGEIHGIPLLQENDVICAPMMDANMERAQIEIAEISVMPMDFERIPSLVSF